MSGAAPGWYHAQGDPPDTERYWDGNQWTEGPRPIGGIPPVTDSGPAAAPEVPGTDAPPAGLGGSASGGAFGGALEDLTPGASAGTGASDTASSSSGSLSDMGDLGSSAPGTPTSMPPIDSGSIPPVSGSAPVVGSSPGIGMPAMPGPGASGLPPASMGTPGPASGFYAEESKATTALILSIVGFFCCGLPSAGGVYFARQEQQGIEAGRRDPSKQGMATAALVIGIIALALWALLIVGWIIALAAV